MVDDKELVHIVVDSLPATDWIGSLSALLVPTVAVIGSIIAYQQYKINKQALKLELYDRRMVIFKHLRSYLSEIMRTGKVSYEQAIKFNFDTSEATFLVDDKINKHIKDIYEKSIEMAQLNEQMYPEDGSRGLPIGDERSKVAHNHSSLLKWMSDELVELKPLFSKHLGLKQ